MSNPKHTIDLAGQRFGRLVVSRRAGTTAHRRSLWECRCDCGNTRLVPADNLKRENTRSCGCLRKEVAKELNTVHGGTRSREFNTWKGMQRRCYLQSAAGFKNYGGRGIAVCDRWLHSFENFLADMGCKPSPKHSIDRINNDGNYEPGNCRWATAKEQRQNRRRR